MVSFLPTSSPLMALMSSGLRESLSQTFWLMTPMLGRMKGFSSISAMTASASTVATSMPAPEPSSFTQAVA